MVYHDDRGFFDTAIGGVASFGIIWLLICIVLIVGTVVIIGLIIKNNHKHRGYAQSNEALKILKERFARGEIDEDEYRAKKKVLEEDEG